MDVKKVIDNKGYLCYNDRCEDCVRAALIPIFIQRRKEIGMLIITLIVFLYMLLVAGLGLLLAAKRGWITMTARIGATVLSTLIAIPVSLLIARPVAGLLYDKLIPLLGEVVSGFMTEVAVGAEGLQVLVSLLLAPLLFVPVFALIRLIFMIVIWVLEKCIPSMNEKVKLPISLPLGALNGLLIAVVTLIPLCGFLSLGGSMISTFVEADMCDTAFVRENVLDTLDMTEDEVADLAKDLKSNAAVVVVHKTVGKPVFKALTSAELDTSDTHGKTVRMDMETELCSLVKTAGYAMDAMDTLKKDDFTAADKEVLFATADSFFESEWVRMLAADTLSTMAEKWLDGEDFAGMSRPKLDAALSPTFDCVLSVLASENADTLEEDIHDILDVLGDFMANDLLGEDADYMQLVQKLGASGLLTDMMAKLQANERLAVLATEIKALSMRLVTNMLGAQQLKDGQYAEMMGNVAGTLTDALEMSKEDRDAMVVESVQEQFAAEGYDVPPEVVVEITDQVVAELGADGEITEEELTDYFLNHSDEALDYIPGGVPTT